MNNQVEVMTFAQLKQFVEQLEQQESINEETKVFIDTGWDSVQVTPDAFHVEKIVGFEVEDELTKEIFHGFALEAKAKKCKSQANKKRLLF